MPELPSRTAASRAIRTGAACASVGSVSHAANTRQANGHTNLAGWQPQVENPAPAENGKDEFTLQFKDRPLIPNRGNLANLFSTQLLAQPEKLLRDGDGISHRVLPIDDDGRRRVGDPHW